MMMSETIFNESNQNQSNLETKLNFNNGKFHFKRRKVKFLLTLKPGILAPPPSRNSLCAYNLENYD